MNKDNTIDFLVELTAFVLSIFVTSALIYWLWPHVIPVVLPRLVDEGYITCQISYSESIQLFLLYMFFVRGFRITYEHKNS